MRSPLWQRHPAGDSSAPLELLKGTPRAYKVVERVAQMVDWRRRLLPATSPSNAARLRDVAAINQHISLNFDAVVDVRSVRLLTAARRTMLNAA